MMQTLLVCLKHKSGVQKTWKLDPHQTPYAIGSSTHVPLNVTLFDVDSVVGVFDYFQDNWHFISLGKSSAGSDSAVCQKIKADTQITIGSLELTFEQQSRPQLSFESALAELTQNAKTGIPHSLYIIRKNGQTLFTELIPKNENPKFKVPEGADVSIIPIVVEEPKDLMRVTSRKKMDESEKKILIATLASSTIILALGIFAPKSAPDMITLPKSENKVSKIIFKNEPKKKPKPAEPPAQQAPKPMVAQNKVQQPPAPAQNTPAPSAGLLKSMAGARISQLIGKVSAQAARSKNIVIGQGVAAGSAPTGRALASIGPIDQAGKDWSKVGAKNVAISTIGTGGAQGIAKLSGGKAGQGGVGLIEDEAEFSGGLDKEVIAQTIRSYLGQIVYCYERQLSANPDLFGKVSVRFTIGSSGAVQAQKISESTLRNSSVEGCILNRLAAWKFPAPQNGTQVNVTYPFLFKSTN